MDKNKNEVENMKNKRLIYEGIQTSDEHLNAEMVVEPNDLLVDAIFRRIYIMGSPILENCILINCKIITPPQKIEAEHKGKIQYARLFDCIIESDDLIDCRLDGKPIANGEKK